MKAKLKIFTWNINGIKNKFANENILSILLKFDLVIINETHFGVRSKCPENFTLIGRSKKVISKLPRGGVAIYRSPSCPLDIELIYDGF